MRITGRTSGERGRASPSARTRAGFVLEVRRGSEWCFVISVDPWRSRDRGGAIAIARSARCQHEHAIATALVQEAAPSLSRQ